MVGIVTFHRPGISPALWGQADGNNPTLSPALHYRKSHRGSFSMFESPHFSGTVGTSSPDSVRLDIKIRVHFPQRVENQLVPNMGCFYLYGTLLPATRISHPI